MVVLTFVLMVMAASGNTTKGVVSVFPADYISPLIKCLSLVNDHRFLGFFGQNVQGFSHKRLRHLRFRTPVSTSTDCGHGGEQGGVQERISLFGTAVHLLASRSSLRNCLISIFCHQTFHSGQVIYISAHKSELGPIGRQNARRLDFLQGINMEDAFVAVYYTYFGLVVVQFACQLVADQAVFKNWRRVGYSRLDEKSSLLGKDQAGPVFLQDKVNFWCFFVHHSLQSSQVQMKEVEQILGFCCMSTLKPRRKNLFGEKNVVESGFSNCRDLCIRVSHSFDTCTHVNEDGGVVSMGTGRVATYLLVCICRNLAPISQQISGFESLFCGSQGL